MFLDIHVSLDLEVLIPTITQSCQELFKQNKERSLPGPGHQAGVSLGCMLVFQVQYPFLENAGLLKRDKAQTYLIFSVVPRNSFKNLSF